MKFTLIFLIIFKDFKCSRRKLSRHYSFKLALTNRSVWLLGLTYTCFYFIMRGFLSWMPSYFIKKYGMVIISASLLSGAYLSISIIGAFIGTWIANAKFRRDKKRAMLIFLILSSTFSALLTFNDSLDVFLLPLLLFSLSLCEWFFFTLVPLIVPPDFSGTASGIIDALGYLGSLTGTYFIGWFYDTGLPYNVLFFTFFILTLMATLMTSLIKS